MQILSVLLLICLVHVTYCRDFYMGMFLNNDFLVAADELYKPMKPSRITYAQYGRVFKCPITYFRVVDRLGSIANPRVEILKGGLQKKYVVARLSVYNHPISVNIYVGCTNKMKVTRPRHTTKAAVVKTTVDQANTTSGGDTTDSKDATSQGDVTKGEDSQTTNNNNDNNNEVTGETTAAPEE